MSTPLTPALRERMEEALLEAIESRGMFMVGSAGYLVTLAQTPDGTELEGHELEDVLEMWSDLREE